MFHKNIIFLIIMVFSYPIRSQAVKSVDEAKIPSVRSLSLTLIYPLLRKYQNPAHWIRDLRISCPNRMGGFIQGPRLRPRRVRSLEFVLEHTCLNLILVYLLPLGQLLLSINNRYSNSHPIC